MPDTCLVGDGSGERGPSVALRPIAARLPASPSRRAPATLATHPVAAISATVAVAAWVGLLALATPIDALTIAAGVLGVGGLLLATALLTRRAGSAARELAEARRSLTSVALTTHELLWRTDATGRLTWTNDVSRELLGYQPAELVGRPVSELVDPAGLPLLRRRAREVAQTGSCWRDVPQRVRHRDGHVLLIESSGRPVVDHTGVVGYEGTVRPMLPSKAEAHRLAAERHWVSSLLGPNSVRVAFQPIVNLANGHVMGAEALSRFRKAPESAPDACFSRAWEVGLGVALELQSVRAALAALPALPDGLYMSVNAAPRTVLDPAFAQLVLDGTAPLHRLVLEITEHESIDDYAELLDVLAYARCRGLRLAVDDAGAGYASFRHIVTLRPDYIKLDRDLVAGIDVDPARRALASAVVVFALELDAAVIAEGVETPRQLDTLCSLSVDAAQGFYLGRPVVDVEAWQGWRSATSCVPGQEFGTGAPA
jgi:PAS domain S-box-containing protein